MGYNSRRTKGKRRSHVGEGESTEAVDILSEACLSISFADPTICMAKDTYNKD